MNNRTRFFIFTLILGSLVSVACNKSPGTAEKLFEADHAYFQITGRVDFTNPKLPRFWAPGVYIKAKFTGQSCEVIINDQVLWGKSHNYISVIIDDMPAKRIKLTKAENKLLFDGLKGEEHTIIVCKGTESNIGYIEFGGLTCKSLLPLEEQPNRRIEFYGDSITCGAGSDESDFKCGEGEWYDQHNAWLSYGPITARALNAQWMLSSFSGIGMIHSCCDMRITMPDVYDKVNMQDDAITWDFSYKPDVVTICLGQNDGVQDSTAFCSAYVKFIDNLHTRYPEAEFICLSSPMADDNLLPVIKKYLSSVVAYFDTRNEVKISSYFFSKRFLKGCGAHPDLDEHEQIAGELASYIKQLKKW